MILDRNNNNDCFIKENKDFNEGIENNYERLGLNLHKSYSRMSIIAPRDVKKNCLGLTKSCRECFKIQRHCSECNLKLLLKKHLTGRSSREEFHEFLNKCMTESTPEYKLLFNYTLDSTTRELGLADKILKLDKKMPFEHHKAFHNKKRPSRPESPKTSINKNELRTSYLNGLSNIESNLIDEVSNLPLEVGNLPGDLRNLKKIDKDDQYLAVYWRNYITSLKESEHFEKLRNVIPQQDENINSFPPSTSFSLMKEKLWKLDNDILEMKPSKSLTLLSETKQDYNSKSD